MPAIFISHSSRDQAIADDVTQALKRSGFEEVFLDFDKDTGIGAGADWEKTLYEKLARCHALLLVLTPNWLASTWCRIELAQARALGKVILPIVCAPLGDKFVLPEIQSVDVIDWKSDGLDRIEKRLQAITSELARGFSFEAGRSPYPGIQAFEAEDAAIYFGRDEETRGVIERLDARRSQGGSRLIVIIGASGAGKSSLLRAGVLPQLARRKRDWVVLPPLRPEKAPVEVLAKAIAEKLGKPDDWRNWETKLGGPVAIDHISELLKDFRIGESKAATVLLPIDQFEEAFTVASPAQRAGFLNLIATALDPTRDLPLMVVATGRSDVLEGLIETGVLAQLMETYSLAPMPLDRVPRLVEGPAAVASINVDKGLSERIARDVETSDALPLLAHALWLLYRRGSGDKRLSHTEYDALGDAEHGLNPIQNSVRLVADQALAGVKPDERELAALRDAFVPHLVRIQLADGKRVRQPARLSELPSESMRLIRSLVEARLLTTRSQGGTDAGAPDTIVEVTHEALFKAWPTLEGWLNEEQSFLADIERIRGAQEIWTQAADAHRDEALLHGLLLSRARDWLLRYPQRFIGRDLEATRGFIVASADAEDRRRLAAEAQREKTRRMERMLFRGAIAAAVLCAAAAGVVTQQYFAAERARVEAVAERQRAETERSRALLSESRFLANQATQIAATDPTNAMLVALSGLPDANGGIERPYVMETEAALRTAAYARRERFVLHGHEAKLWDAAFSPDGTKLVTVSEDQTARLWDTATGRALAVMRGHDGMIDRTAFSPDGARLITSSNDVTRIWDAATGREIAVVRGHIGAFSTDVFTPDGKHFVTVNHKDRSARIWNAESGLQVAHVADPEGEVRAAAFSADGRYLATAPAVGAARIWDTATWREHAVLHGHQGGAGGLHFSPDGTRLATASGDQTVRIWNVADGRALMVLRAERDSSSPIPWIVWGVSFNADGTRLLTKSVDGLQLWDTATGRQLPAFPTSGTAFWVGAFSPDGTSIVTAEKDKIARIWDARTGRETAAFAGHAAGLARALFSPDGARIATISDDLTARLWDVKAPSELTAIPGVKKLWDVDVSAQGTRIATVSAPDKENVVQVQDIAGGRIVMRIGGDLIASARFSPNGKHLVTGSADRTATLWEVDSGRRLGVMAGHPSTVFTTAFSRDGSRLLTWSNDGTGKLWDPATRQPVATFEMPNRRIINLQFSPGARRILGVSQDLETKKDSKLHIWDGTDGKHIAVFDDPKAELKSAAYSDDDGLLAVSHGATIRIHDGLSGKLLRSLEGHTGDVGQVRFNPDATRLVTISADKAAKVWDVSGGRMLFTLMDTPDIVTAAFDPSGGRLLTGTLVGGLRFWDLRTGTPIGQITPTTAALPTIRFVGDGARVLATLHDTVYLFDAKTGFQLGVVKYGVVFGTPRPASNDSMLVVAEPATGPGFFTIPTTTQGFVDHVKQIAPRCLTLQERETLLLDPAPPDWCIEREKWPYHTDTWKQWLAERRRGGQLPMPERADRMFLPGR